MIGSLRALLALSSWLLITMPAVAETVDVSIADFAFAPKTLNITVGDQVRWTNTDPFTHTTTQDAANGWDSGDLSQNATFLQTFTKAGTYPYHCNKHPTQMKGTITVTAAPQSRQQIGREIIKKWVRINLDLKGKNPSKVYLGSYIVNAQAGCANCHSCPTYQQGHNPYLGQPKLFNTTSYLAGGTVVHGGGQTELSANLTPDAVTHRPANLSLKAFKNLLRTGHDPDVPGALLQVMPWPVFGMMGDADLDAVYEYLRAIPTAEMPGNHCAEPGQ
jgi:plastocyanin